MTLKSTLFYLLVVCTTLPVSSQIETIVVHPRSSFDQESFNNVLSTLPLENESVRYVLSNSEKRTRTLRFVSITCSEEAASSIVSKLATLQYVDYIELDQWGELSSCQSYNDPGWNSQWYLENNGSRNGAVVGADVSACEAWDIAQGDSTILIGFIDSGNKSDHSDLTGRVWTNAGETAGDNIDNDNNGYVDDIYGWNTFNSTNNIADNIGHGTQINGIVGSNPNNGNGFVGLDWNCKLMNVNGVNAQGQGLSSWWAEGIYYLVDNGADIINMSLSIYSNTQVLQDAVDYAMDNEVIIVAAAGNDNIGNISYPAKYSEVIAVGATDHADERAIWNGLGSNHGPEMDVVAPGKAIYGINPFNNTTQYVTAGTSQATPIVSALCGLLLSLDPSLSGDSIRKIIRKTAEDQVGTSNEDLQGFDNYHGYGRVNCFRALNFVDSLLHPISGLNNIDNAELWQISPNPTSNHINVTVEKGREGQTVFIRNLYGELVLQQRLRSGNSSLDISVLSSGLYFVSLHQNGQFSQRLIVQ